MRWILNHTPTAPLGLGIVGLAVVVALFFLVLARRAAVDTVANDALGVLFTVVGIVYGIMLAFAIVILWSNFEAARQTVGNEASALAAVVTDTRPLAMADRQQVDHAVTNYIRAITVDEWRTMRVGRESALAEKAREGLVLALQQAHLAPGVQTTWYDQAAMKVNDVVTARRQRLDASQGQLPFPFEILIFVGSLIPIAFMPLVRVPHRSIHALMVVVVAALVGYALFLVVLLGYPFSGTVSVSTEPFHIGVLARLSP